MVETKYVNRNDQGVATEATGIALSLDGQTVFVASVTSVTAYDVSSSKVKAEINLSFTDIRPLCPMRGGVLILTRENTAELWDYRLSKRIKWWTNLPGVEQLIPISEEQVAVVGEVDVKVLDTSSGKAALTIPVLQGRVLTCNSKCQLLIERFFKKCSFLDLFLLALFSFWMAKQLFGKRKALLGSLMIKLWLSHLWNSSLLLARLKVSLSWTPKQENVPYFTSFEIFPIMALCVYQ